MLENAVEPTKDENVSTGVRVLDRSKPSIPEARSFREKIRKMFLAFSEWCNRLEMEDRGFSER